MSKLYYDTKLDRWVQISPATCELLNLMQHLGKLVRINSRYVLWLMVNSVWFVKKNSGRLVALK